MKKKKEKRKSEKTLKKIEIMIIEGSMVPTMPQLILRGLGVPALVVNIIGESSQKSIQNVTW